MPINEKEIKWDPIDESKVTWDEQPGTLDQKGQVSILNPEAPHPYDVAQNREIPKWQKFGKPSLSKTIRTKFTEGMTFGGLDEMVGAAHAITGPGTYKEERDRARQFSKTLHTQRPVVSTVSDIAGGIFGAATGAGLMSKLGVGAAIASKAPGAVKTISALPKVIKAGVKLATYGGLAGYGYGEREGVKGGAKDAAIGSIISVALGTTFKVGGEILKRLPKIPKKLLSALGGVKENRIDDYIARRPDILATEATTDVIKVSGEGMKALDNALKRLSEKSSESFRILKKTGKNIKKDRVIKIVNNELNDLMTEGAYGKNTKAGVKGLTALKKDLLQDDNTLFRKLLTEKKLTQSPSEFNPVKMDLIEELQRLKEIRRTGDVRLEYDTLKELIQNDPARELQKHMNKKTGRLYEVLGKGRAEFSRSGDDISKNLGYPDSETARLAFDNYRDNMARLKDLSKALSQPQKEINLLKEQIKLFKGTERVEPITPDNVPIANIKNFMWGVEDMIADTKQYRAGGQMQRTLYKIRTGLDNILKDESPRYKKYMKGLAQRTEETITATKGIKQPDTLLRLLNQSAHGKETHKIGQLQSLLKKEKSPAFQDIKDLITSQAFAKDMTRGSKNTFLGAGAGMAVASFLGVPYPTAIAMGAALGHVKDKYGGKITKEVLNMYIDIATRIPAKPQIFGQFAGIIGKAQARGLPALAATHAILYNMTPKEGSNEPSYKELYDENFNTDEIQPRSTKQTQQENPIKATRGGVDATQYIGQVNDLQGKNESLAR